MKTIFIIIILFLFGCFPVTITKNYYIQNVAENGSSVIQTIDPITTTADVQAIP